MNQLKLLAAAMLTAACSSVFAAAPSASPLQVTFQVLDGWPAGDKITAGAPKGAVVEGQLRRVRMTLKNVGKMPIVLMRIDTDRKEERGATWQKSEYGDIHWDPATKTFVHNGIIQQATPVVFNSGLVWQGQEAKVEFPTRYVKTPKTVTATYYTLDTKQLSAWFYPGTGSEGDLMRRFKAMMPEQLIQAKPRNGVFLVNIPTGRHALSVKGWKSPGKPPSPSQATFSHHVTMQPRSVGIEKDKIPIPADVIGYCDALKAWIVRGEDNATWVTDGKTRFRIPSVDAQVWDLMDSTPGSYLVQVETKQPDRYRAPRQEPVPRPMRTMVTCSRYRLAMGCTHTEFSLSCRVKR